MLLFCKREISFIELDFESFLIMKPHHIKDAIPSLGPRIKFENLYEKFLSGLDEVIIVDQTNQENETPIQEVCAVNTNDQKMCAMNTDADINLNQTSGEKLMSLEEDIPKINEVMWSTAPKEKNYLRTAKVYFYC